MKTLFKAIILFLIILCIQANILERALMHELTVVDYYNNGEYFDAASFYEKAAQLYDSLREHLKTKQMLQLAILMHELAAIGYYNNREYSNAVYSYIRAADIYSYLGHNLKAKKMLQLATLVNGKDHGKNDIHSELSLARIRYLFKKVNDHMNSISIHTNNPERRDAIAMLKPRFGSPKRSVGN